MTEREKRNEEIKADIRKLGAAMFAFAAQFAELGERLCNHIDTNEDLMKFHERNTETLARHIDETERVIG